jgi:hypothetical protein
MVRQCDPSARAAGEADPDQRAAQRPGVTTGGSALAVSLVARSRMAWVIRVGGDLTHPYATQIPGTATFSKRCGAATALSG